MKEKNARGMESGRKLLNCYKNLKTLEKNVPEIDKKDGKTYNVDSNAIIKECD